MDDGSGVVEIFGARWRELGKYLGRDTNEVAVEPMSGVGDIFIEEPLCLGTHCKVGVGLGDEWGFEQGQAPDRDAAHRSQHGERGA